MKFYWLDTFKELSPILINSLGVVLQITIITFCIFIVFSSLLAIGRIIGPKPLRGMILAFTEIIRGTPLLVQLFYIYYVVPIIIAYIKSLSTGEFEYPEMSSLIAGIVGLSICYSCYVSEVIHSAILNIDYGQMEAGLVLGLSKKQTLLKIIFPQAMKNSIPEFGNYLVMLVKDTSILQCISVQEMLMVTRDYSTRTFHTIESFTLVALVYLAICLPLSKIVKHLDKKTKIVRHK